MENVQNRDKLVKVKWETEQDKDYFMIIIFKYLKNEVKICY